MSRIFTVHPPPGGALGEPVLIAEGFSWGAVLAGPLWFAWYRAWIGLAVHLVGLLVLLGLHGEIDLLIHGLLAAGFAWLVGVSANDGLRLEWAARGWRMADVVVARNRTEALIAWVVRRADETAPARRPAAPSRPLPVGGPASPLAPWSP